MGLFGAVFGVATVLGPLIGGFFVEYLSWRWVFYINIPIGVVALFVTAAQLPGHLQRVHHVIDYLGTILLTLATTALVLFTSLGGTTYRWGSAPIIGMAVAGVVLTVLFLVVERRAAEPVIPLGLFANRVFSAASAVGFVMGFAMFGALTFLPIFFQDARGLSPPASGLRLLPLMGGLLLASTGAGQLVSRWGRYKVFPVVGTFLMIVGLLLMSRIGLTTGGWTIAGFLFVFGVGLGLVMQVLVVAVQNAVPYEQLGTATSGATFFRMIGGSFGTAVFGAVFANLLVTNVVHALHLKAVPSNLVSCSERGRPDVAQPSAAGASGRGGGRHGAHHPDRVPYRCSHRGCGLRVVVAAPRYRVAEDGAQRRPGQGARDARVALVARGDPAVVGALQPAGEPGRALRHVGGSGPGCNSTLDRAGSSTGSPTVPIARSRAWRRGSRSTPSASRPASTRWWPRGWWRRPQAPGSASSP